ncbi:MAG TPA: AAA family ATPase [Nitrospira sp.]|nr:AAA family ATPase [Nitrospira sp.]
MYESFYKLKAKPFALLPDSSFLYQGSEHQAAYSLLEYGILSEAPFMVLTGDPGVGKTSLLQKLMAEHGTRHKIGLVTNARYDIEQLLPWILLSLGLSTKRLDPIEAYHLFSEFLSQESKRSRRVILVIDEAQSLGAELLEELRLLSNMNDGTTLKLQIILSGQPDLYTLLQRIDMTQFAQRIVVDYHLKPLSETDTAKFIRHRLQLAGGRPALFTDQACALVHRLSQGNPRLINQVADITLTYGYAEQLGTITAKLVAQAALDRIKGRILPLSATEELVQLASAVDEPLEQEDSYRRLAVSVVADPPSEAASSQLLEEDYQRAITLKERGQFKEAIELFHIAAKGNSLWFRAYAQVGFCYVKMRDPQAAIQAFRTALEDQMAGPNEVMDVLYCLGRSLESVGKVDQARDVYDQINQSVPAFRDVGNRLSQLNASPQPQRKLDEQFTARPSWVSGMIDNVQRFLIGSQK